MNEETIGRTPPERETWTGNCDCLETDKTYLLPASLVAKIKHDTTQEVVEEVYHMIDNYCITPSNVHNYKLIVNRSEFKRLLQTHFKYEK